MGPVFVKNPLAARMAAVHTAMALDIPHAFAVMVKNYVRIVMEQGTHMDINA